jgi:hypothetical protein
VKPGRLAAFALALSCARPTAPASSPDPATAAAAPPGTPSSEPSARATSPEPVPEGPSAIQLPLGWVHDADDPAAPIIQLVELDARGTGMATAEAIVGAFTAILDCWEVELKRRPGAFARVHVRWALPTSASGRSLELHGDGGDDLLRCADAAIRPRLPPPSPGDFLQLGIAMHPRRDGVVLRDPRADLEISVRTADTCWQLEDYPCAPNKHCRAAEWIRTACGDPTMHDDVALRLGLGPPDASGRCAPVDARLVAADGQALWWVPLPARLREFWGAHFPADEAPAADVEGRLSTFAVRRDPTRLWLADASGLHVFGRHDGVLLASWVADPPGEPKLWFDTGTWEIRIGARRCTGDAGHGAFFATCEDRHVWFDGYTLAVFEGQPPKLRDTTHLGARGTRHEATHLSPRAKLKLAGVTVSVTGQIFVQ